MRKLVMLLMVGGFAAPALALAQYTNTPTNAEVEVLEEARRSVSNQVIVQEIEAAGFEIDVEEGFDEEWEEEIWVAAEADDVSANYVDPSEDAKYDVLDIPEADELAADWSEESWDNPETIVDAHDTDLALVAEEDELGDEVVVMRGEGDDADVDHSVTDESDDVLLADFTDFEDETLSTEGNWWEEETNNWSAFADELDLEEFELDNEEEEDLDLLEELYGAN